MAEKVIRKFTAAMNEHDRWLFLFPLYVNAMPGILKRLFEHLNTDGTRRAGYFCSPAYFINKMACLARRAYGSLGSVTVIARVSCAAFALKKTWTDKYVLEQYAKEKQRLSTPV